MTSKRKMGCFSKVFIFVGFLLVIGVLVAILIPLSRKPESISPKPTSYSQHLYARVDCNIREGPGTNFPIIRVAKKGEELISEGLRNDWYHLKQDKNASAWVHKTVVVSSRPISSNPTLSSVLSGDYEHILGSELGYLKNIREVQWIEIDSNTVYVGFAPIPSDYREICNAAAFIGNRAINFGVHVWAIDATKYNNYWRPGSGTALYETTCRHGQFE
jgi:hypothetical protein